MASSAGLSERQGPACRLEVPSKKQYGDQRAAIPRGAPYFRATLRLTQTLKHLNNSLYLCFTARLGGEGEQSVGTEGDPA